MTKLPLLALLAGLFITPIATAKDGAPSRLFPYFEEDSGVAILGEVAYVGSREEIVASGPHYEFLMRSGIPDSDLTDGRLAVVRYYCCGGRISEDQEIWTYVLPGITLEAGDIVQVRMGRVPQAGDAGVVNIVDVLRQKRFDAAGGPCRWEPDNPSLWMRVVYCSGIEQQGWQQRGKLRKLWYLPKELVPPVMATASADTGSQAGEEAVATATVDEAVPAPAVEDGLPAPVDDADIAATMGADALADCIAVQVDRSMAGLVMEAASTVSPSVELRLQGAADAQACSYRLALDYTSVVDESSQTRNKGGAAAAGLTGWLVGSITPWACPTTHSLTGVLTSADGTAIATLDASQTQKRVGTMLACGEVERPNDEIAKQLAAEVLKQAAAYPGPR